ncbi:hypothetical protein [Caballeronia sordidicola]|nr:hypothetical protein [Caballeronia sordidicola]
MAGTKRKSNRTGTNRKPLSKALLLPMAAISAREMSLAHHLALAACRDENGNRYLINELTRSVYMSYFLQRLGFGNLPLECFDHAEAVIENALAVAEKTSKWTISEHDAPAIERVLTLHDQQLNEAPMHRVVEAEKQLRQFIASTAASPLIPSKSK